MDVSKAYKNDSLYLIETGTNASMQALFGFFVWLQFTVWVIWEVIDHNLYCLRHMSESEWD